MSWARVDDGLWEHPKFEALRESGSHAAASLWLFAISYCGRKQTPRVTIREAAMLLCADEATAQSACDVLRSNGLLDDDSASKQNRSYLIHDWEHYRSKDEAKAAAGRQGGKKSGESRRSKREAEPKQNGSAAQADTKQTRTPDPVPVPEPDPGPDPLTADVITDKAALGNELRKHGVTLVIGAEEGFGKYLPCQRKLVAEAVSETIARIGKPKSGYVLSVLESARERAATKPAVPPKTPEPSKNTDRAEWVLVGKRFGIYGMDPYQLEKLRALSPAREDIERACQDAAIASPDIGATWDDVIAHLGAPRAQAC